MISSPRTSSMKSSGNGLRTSSYRTIVLTGDEAPLVFGPEMETLLCLGTGGVNSDLSSRHPWCLLRVRAGS